MKSRALTTANSFSHYNKMKHVDNKN